MSSNAVSPRQLEQLFQSLEDCQISGAEHAQLMDLLREDADVRSAYIDHMEFAGLLHAKAEASAELDGAEAFSQEVPSSKQFMRSLMAAAAMLTLAAIAASFLYGPSIPPAGIVAGPNAAWKFVSGGMDSKRGFLPGSMIALDYGTLDIKLGTGTEMILEGPAKLKIMSPELVYLPDGRLWARAAGEKFVVKTERLNVVDLGTEFGVLASDVLDEEVHVWRGSVRVEPKHPELEPITLVSGEAVRANGIGKVRRVPFTSAGFLTRLPAVVPYQHWSFDESPDDEFPSSGMGIEAAPMDVYSLDKEVELTVKRTKGRFGDALHMSETASFARAGFQGIEGDVARTVALWVKGAPQAKGEESNPTLVAWGLPTTLGTKWRLTVGHSGRGVGTVWGGRWANSKLAKGKSVFDGEWHHLAYVYTGRVTDGGHPEILHYVDGEALEIRHASDPTLINTECTAKHSRPLTLGSQIIWKPSRDTFIGAIDELYVFRGVLDERQIRSLYEFNSLDGKGGPPAAAALGVKK